MSTPTNLAMLASTYLKAIGAPDTTENRRAMAAWIAVESGFVRGSNRTEVNVVGNNPFNIKGSGDCGYRTYLGSHFAVYCTPASGAAGWTYFIENNQRHFYPQIVDAFRANNPDVAIQAIITSPWDQNHYANGSLTGVYKTLGGDALNIVSPPSGIPSSTSPPTIDPNSVLLAYMQKYVQPNIGKQTWYQGIFTDSSQGFFGNADTPAADYINSIVNSDGIDLNTTITQQDYDKVVASINASPVAESKVDPNSTIKAPWDNIAQLFADPGFIFKVGAIILGSIFIINGAKVIVSSANPVGSTA